MVGVKCIHSFQALPKKIPSQYFQQAHSLFIKFIWANSKPRLPRRYLTLPKHHGGLALPDLRNYYLAVHLGRIIDWNRHYKNKLWTQLEQAQTEVLLKGALWCYDNISPKLKAHPIIGTTLSTYSKTIISSSLSNKDSPLLLLLGNPAFPPGLGKSEYRTLAQVGHVCTSHFLEGDKWPPLTGINDRGRSLSAAFLECYSLTSFSAFSCKPSPF